VIPRCEWLLPQQCMAHQRRRSERARPIEGGRAATGPIEGTIRAATAKQKRILLKAANPGAEVLQEPFMVTSIVGADLGALPGHGGYEKKR